MKHKHGLPCLNQTCPVNKEISMVLWHPLLKLHPPGPHHLHWLPPWNNTLTHNSNRQDGLWFIGENGYILHDSNMITTIIANLCSKLYYEVLLKSRNYIVNLLKQTLVFRTWIVRFGCLVWVGKLTDIVTKSLLCIYELCLESCFGSKEIKHLLQKDLLITRNCGYLLVS